jgi:hypothetical protein
MRVISIVSVASVLVWAASAAPVPAVQAYRFAPTRTTGLTSSQEIGSVTSSLELGVDQHPTARQEESDTSVSCF